MSISSGRYKPFLRGETVALCVPSEAAIEDGWAEWFNDPAITQWLDQGVFPHHVEQQQEFLAGLRAGSRFAVLICDPDANELYGIVSLSTLNWIARSGQLGLVIGRLPLRNELIALEAVALVTEHAFTRMGLSRIWGVQAFPALDKWNETMDLIGYRTDGFARRGFAKGRQVSGSASISITYEEYAALVARRGKYWLGNTTMLKLFKARPKQGLAHRIADAVERIQSEHDAAWVEIERSILPGS